MKVSLTNFVYLSVFSSFNPSNNFLKHTKTSETITNIIIGNVNLSSCVAWEILLETYDCSGAKCHWEGAISVLTRAIRH